MREADMDGDGGNGRDGGLAAGLLTDDVCEALRRARYDRTGGAPGGVLRLDDRPRPFAVTGRVHAALAALGGRWCRKRRGFMFRDDPTPRLRDLVGPGPAGRPAAPTPFTPTPPAAAREVVRLAELPGPSGRRLRILEPAAGNGTIFDALADAGGGGHGVTAVELDPARADALAARGFRVLARDFLALDPAGLAGFDRVLLHPPFVAPGNVTFFVDYVRHALKFLAPGGRLVALVPGAFLGAARHHKLVAFRDLISARGRADPAPPPSLPGEGPVCPCVIVIIDNHQGVDECQRT